MPTIGELLQGLGLNTTKPRRGLAARLAGGEPGLDLGQFQEPVFNPQTERFEDQFRSDVFVPRTLGESRIDVNLVQGEDQPGTQLGGPGQNVQVGRGFGDPISPAPPLDLSGGGVPLGSTGGGGGGGLSFGSIAKSIGLPLGSAVLKKIFEQPSPVTAAQFPDFLNTIDTGLAQGGIFPGQQDLPAPPIDNTLLENVAGSFGASPAGGFFDFANATFEPGGFSNILAPQEGFFAEQGATLGGAVGAPIAGGALAGSTLGSAAGVPLISTVGPNTFIGASGAPIASTFGAEAASTGAAATGTSFGSILSGLGAGLGVAGVLSAPIMEALERPNERKDTAESFLPVFSEAFQQVGLQPPGLFEVGGGGKQMSPLSPLPPELKPLEGAFTALEMSLAGNENITDGGTRDSGGLMRWLVQNNLVDQNATPEQTQAILAGALGGSLESAVDIVMKANPTHFNTRFLGHGSASSTDPFGTLRQFETGTASGDAAVKKLNARLTEALNGIEALFGQPIPNKAALIAQGNADVLAAAGGRASRRKEKEASEKLGRLSEDEKEAREEGRSLREILRRRKERDDD